MSKLIDLKSHSVNTVFNLLLKDRTTNKNIIFATDAYDGIDFTTAITKKLLLSGSVDIRPRVLKSLEEQTQRTRKKAEVFTPAWICNQMNNYCDTEWFGREKIFNVEQDHTWIPTTEKITFSNGKSWKNYIDSKCLEITCGEAPYLVSRYDVSTAEIIPIEQRIGILDRKLRVINENVDNYTSWNQWVYRAFQSVYGYEFQGDNLLIARINLLETFCEYTRERWQVEPTDSALRQIANIISWNLWQMDGIHGVIPYVGEAEEQNEPYQMSLFETEKKPLETIDCKVYDWCKNKEICYKSMRGGNAMKFDFCIGNPPYQEMDGGAQASATPAYHYFMKSGKQISQNVELIMPSRWMTGGKGLDKFRKEMIHDTSIKVLHDYANSKDVFDNVDIKGGVCIVFWSKEYSGKCKCIRYITGKIDESIRFLCDEDDDIFIRENALVNIKNKVISNMDKAVSLIISARKPYGLAADTMKSAKKYGLPEFSNVAIKDGYEILGLGKGQKREWKYIPKDYPLPKKSGLGKWKVFVAEAYGCGNIGEAPSTPVIGTPIQICTETFLEIGPFDTQNEASNFLKYLKTKFFRALVSIKKQTQHTTRKVYTYVPLQDFTSSSDIDWTQSISNIDQQLYKKYNLSEEEIYFIETNVKEME